MNEGETTQDHGLPGRLWRLLAQAAFLCFFLAIFVSIFVSEEIAESRMRAMAGFVGLGLLIAGLQIMRGKRFDSRFTNRATGSVRPIHLSGARAQILGGIFMVSGVLLSVWSAVFWYGFFKG